ncbi:MAG: phosphate/phosphite/phosphonate ABC transporter substrate-binding protein [Sulfuricurvum sp.]|jgi:phosphonate transport system substrate-binding protein
MINIIFALLLIFFFSGCQNTEPQNGYAPKYSESPPIAKKTIYIFGIYMGENPKSFFDIYQPMVDYINGRLTDSELRIEASRNYASYNQKLFSGHFDFALSNPYATVTAVEHGYRIFGKMGDDKNFRGLIIVRKDSNIKSVDDLRGKVISYPSSTALAAAIMPQWYFYKHGLDINKDITNSYVGSQESSIMNVYLRKSDVACTWPPPWHNFVKKRPEMAKELMIKWETPSLINNGLVVRNDIPDTVVKQVGEIIFSLHTDEEGRKILGAMDLNRYEKADDQTYERVRVFLKNFENQIRPMRLNNE